MTTKLRKWGRALYLEHGDIVDLYAIAVGAYALTFGAWWVLH